MMIEVGEVLVVLDHVKTKGKVDVRKGKVFKCPECAGMVIYKWTDVFKMDNEVIKKLYPYWVIYLEDHEHLNWRRGRK